MIMLKATDKITGAIFAGGQSTRMGIPKEGVILRDNRPMIDHIIDALRPLSSRIIIVGACKGFDIPEDPQLFHIQDIHPGHGPLSALEALLLSGFAKEYLVTSCDQPLLTTETLTRMVGGQRNGLAFFRSESGQEMDPFPGIYPAWLLPEVQDAMRQKQFSIRHLIRQHPLQWVTLPDSRLLDLSNANTPESLQELERHISPVARRKTAGERL